MQLILYSIRLEDGAPVVSVGGEMGAMIGILAK